MNEAKKKTAPKQASAIQVDYVTALALQHRAAKAARRVNVEESLVHGLAGYIMGIRSCGLNVAAAELERIWDEESGVHS